MFVVPVPLLVRSPIDLRAVISGRRWRDLWCSRRSRRSRSRLAVQDFAYRICAAQELVAVQRGRIDAQPAQCVAGQRCCLAQPLVFGEALGGCAVRIRSDNVLTVESSSNTGAQASEAVSDVLFAPHPLLLEDARGLPRSRRSPDLTIMNTRSCERPRPYLKQHGVPWKARTLSTGS